MQQKYYILSTIALLFLLITQFGSNRESSELSITEIPNNFVYDGCSMFPDGNYGDCCKVHDDKYFFGGNWKSRLTADNQLYTCVANKWWWHHALAPAMWAWVRLWWAPIFPTPYRWGFGRDRY